MTARYIAIDWGSTICAPGFIRATTAWRAGNQKQRHAPERKISGCGVSRSHDRRREENTPVVMAGMVGSNVGWKLLRIYLFLPVFRLLANN